MINILPFHRRLSLLLTLSALTIALPALAQTTGDYRSAASGNWNAVATWETYDGANWIAASVTPTAVNAGVITIQSPYFVTNTASVTADQIVVAPGATLASSANLTVADGAGTDLEIFGTFLATGGTCLTLNASGSAVVESGGALIHRGTSNAAFTINGTLRFASGGKFTLDKSGGRIPLSTWDTGSLCEVAYTAEGSKPDVNYLNQNFAHFTVNCPIQAGGWDFAARMTNHVQNFILNLGPNPAGTPTEFKMFSGTGTPANLNIGGDLIINSGRFNVGSSGGPWTITLTSNLFVAAGAQFDLSGSANLTMTLILNGTGIQNFTCNGNNTAQKLNWTVNNGSTLNLNSDLPVTATGKTLTANGTVNVNGKTVGANLVAGSGTIRNEGGGSGKLALGASNGTNTLDGTLSLVDGAGGTLGLVKSGNGLLTITAGQAFSGGLVVSNGIALVNNITGSGTGGGAVTVYGGTLGGDGIISGTVSVESGGTLSPARQSAS